MPGITAFKYLAIGTMYLKTLSGAGLQRFNKNFRKVGIQASILLILFRNTGEKKTKATGGD
jgi:hypothetical protein